MSYAGLAGFNPSPVPDRNTEAVRAFSVGSTGVGILTFGPWLDAALEVRGITPAQAPRALEAVRAILAQDNTQIDAVRWGSGSIAGRIYVKWRPRAHDNAVRYANDMARAFLAAAQREFSPSSTFIMRRYRIDSPSGYPNLFVYPEVDFTTVAGARETLPSSIPTAGGGVVPMEEAGKTQAGMGPETMALIGVGVGAGVLLLGGGFMIFRMSRSTAVRANRRRRS